MHIRREAAGDPPRIRVVNIAAFGSTAEADVVDALRARGHEVISLVADDGRDVVGHIMFSPVRVVGAPDVRGVALAPMAVMPPRQRTGIGSALVRAGLEDCRRSGVDAVFVVGHATYYPRFGFVAASTRGFSCEFTVPDEAFMVAELRPGALAGCSGTVIFDDAFRSA